VGHLVATSMLTADFQLIEVGDLAQIKSPEWLEKQPFGQMPFIVDEETGAVIFESRAIARCEYESTTSRDRLY